jgi:hypothetical protein
MQQRVFQIGQQARIIVGGNEGKSQADDTFFGFARFKIYDSFDLGKDLLLHLDIGTNLNCILDVSSVNLQDRNENERNECEM